MALSHQLYHEIMYVVFEILHFQPSLISLEKRFYILLGSHISRIFLYYSNSRYLPELVTYIACHGDSKELIESKLLLVMLGQYHRYEDCLIDLTEYTLSQGRIELLQHLAEGGLITMMMNSDRKTSKLSQVLERILNIDGMCMWYTD